MRVIDHMDVLMRQSCQSLASELASGTWQGRREREVINLFCFGHLLRHCRPGALLHDPTQVAIASTVQQIAEQCGLTGKKTQKSQVCKDILIWPEARMTCWDEHGQSTVAPLSIIEWKHNDQQTKPYDVPWLCAFSAARPAFVGYAVHTRHPAQWYALTCTRVHLGQAKEAWLQIM
jgi:hypothetical protein